MLLEKHRVGCVLRNRVIFSGRLTIWCEYLLLGVENEERSYKPGFWNAPGKIVKGWEEQG